MFTSYYFPHVLYGLALTSVSINLVGHRKQVEEDRARIDAQFSILESIKEQLQQNLQDRKYHSSLKDKTGAEVGWGSIFQGRTPDASDGEKISHWDQKDLDALRKDMEK
ncbi:hypothetical protein BJ165DRAFT_1403284 [Panaeolus papilionaceus]|nr:hypothetical protein BJ165DRAFT_1403284 [Panaeolus papilionaceus]